MSAQVRTPDATSDELVSERSNEFHSGTRQMLPPVAPERASRGLHGSASGVLGSPAEVIPTSPVVAPCSQPAKSWMARFNPILLWPKSSSRQTTKPLRPERRYYSPRSERFIEEARMDREKYRL